ncbi:MAG: hypothetical protein CMH53_09930 [Myxococcales bacterium]|nr:hypothetical protein [Myxococcales bacterium]
MTRILLLFVSMLCLTSCGPRHGHLRHSSADQVIALDRADRNQWQRPIWLMQTLKIRPGMRVVDLGAGAGYLLPHLSKAVGPQGQVIALEVDGDLLAQLRSMVKRLNLTNVKVVRGQPLGMPIPTQADLALMVNTYPELDNPVEMLQSLHDHLKPSGRLAVIDYMVDLKVAGPPQSERLSADTIRAEARGAGFSELQTIAGLPRQYCLVFGRVEDQASDQVSK